MKQLRPLDQEWLWQEIAQVIRRQEPLPAALGKLASAHADTARGAAAERLAASLAAGMTLSRAVAAEAGALPPGAAPAIEAGERSGQLPDVLQALADAARADSLLRHSISQAVLYPALIAFFGAAAMIFIHFAVLPCFQDVWRDLGADVPLLATFMPGFLQVESVVVLLAPALFLIVVYLLPPNALPWRERLDRVRLRCPVLSRPVRRSLLSRWCAAMGPLVQAGVPEAEAVRLAGESCGNAAVAQISRALSAELEKGVSLSEALEERQVVDRAAFFTPQLSWMVQAAEKAGGHGHVWAVARDLYRNDADRCAQAVSVLLRLIFFILAMQVVMMTMQSIMLPLVKLMQSLGG